MLAIECENLSKIFVSKKGPLWNRQRSEFIAVNNVSFSAQKGHIFSLLGPNGAGKTTTIKMLATLLIPDKGQARILGHDVCTHEKKARQLMGTVLPGERTLFWKMTIKENLEYFSDLMGLTRKYSKERIPSLLQQFALEDKKNVLVEKLSTGLRQRAVLARAMLTDPDVLLLDEPTLGLDPLAARSLRQLIKELRNAGKTILLTTHYMYEADELSDTVAIMHKGKIAIQGTSNSLKNALEAQARVTLGAIEFSSTFEAAIMENFSLLDWEKNLLEGKMTLSFSSKEKLSTQKIIEVAQACQFKLDSIQVLEPSLEDVFIAHTGEKLIPRQGEES